MQLELDTLKRDWIDDCLERFELHAPRLGSFSTEDLHRLLPVAPHPNWWGCLVAKLRCSGRIREIGRVKSTRPERNGAKITLWQTI
jgi:hypothetical protein